MAIIAEGVSGGEGFVVLFSYQNGFRKKHGRDGFGLCSSPKNKCEIIFGLPPQFLQHLLEVPTLLRFIAVLTTRLWRFRGTDNVQHKIERTIMNRRRTK